MYTETEQSDPQFDKCQRVPCAMHTKILGTASFQKIKKKKTVAICIYSYFLGHLIMLTLLVFYDCSKLCALSPIDQRMVYTV